MSPTQWPRNLSAASFSWSVASGDARTAKSSSIARHHALFGQRALIAIEAGRVAREIDEVLGCTLPRPIGPIARGAKRGELLILLDERDHALAGGVVQLEECQLADCLVAEAAPGQG